MTCTGSRVLVCDLGLVLGVSSGSGICSGGHWLCQLHGGVSGLEGLELGLGVRAQG